MRGVGTASGAISILNALFTGIGAAAAIDLPVRAELDLERSPADGGEFVVEPAGADTALARAVLDGALRRRTPGAAWRGRLRVESRVPPAVGLKSSSAVSVAIGLAVAAALGESTTVETEARAAAGVARRIGQSATGAFDDALAAGEGGFALTDNRTDEVLARDEPDPAWTLVLWIPPGRHLPSPRWVERFRAHGEAARGAVDAARRRDWLVAMRRNGELVALALGQAAPVPRGLSPVAGALARSVSGLGPAVAFVVRAERAEEVRSTLSAEAGAVNVVPFRARAPLEGAGR